MRLLYLLGAFAICLFIPGRGAAPHYLAIGLALPGIAGWSVITHLVSDWPVAPRDLSFIRSTAAAIALLAVIRLHCRSFAYDLYRTAVTVALGTAAIMSVAAFYNLGRPQFEDHLHNRPEFVHTFDMRVYQPFAKYFNEVGYDGIYSASVLAYAEDRLGGELTTIDSVKVRDLVDHRMRTVGDISDQISAVRKRFSDQRWIEFKRDMNYFEDVMGPDFLSSLADHGANATPVWVLFARLFLGRAPASETLLVFTGLIDGILLLVMAYVLWKAFGLWQMLIALTVFGATDIYMGGSDWSGATLRHDWLVLLGCSVAAARCEHWTVAGLCLGTSAMIRAFPAVAIVGVMLPVCWTIAVHMYTTHSMISREALIARHRPALKVLAGALGCMCALFLLSASLYSLRSWIGWWHKVTMLNSDVGVNEISLRSLVAGTGAEAQQLLRTRWSIVIVLKIITAVCVAIACRSRPVYQVIPIALPLMYVISNPSNYYSHVVCIVVLCCSSPMGASVIPLLMWCVCGYWISNDIDRDRHFQESTVLLFGTLSWIYVRLLSDKHSLESTRSEMT